MGDPSPSIGLRPGDQRPRLSIFSSLSQRIHRYISRSSSGRSIHCAATDKHLECDPELFDVTHLPAGALAAVEADSFWCLSKLLDGIQDNYISHQPGIQRLVKRMGELVKRIDGALRLRLRPRLRRL